VTLPAIGLREEIEEESDPLGIESTMSSVENSYTSLMQKTSPMKLKWKDLVASPHSMGLSRPRNSPKLESLTYQPKLISYSKRAMTVIYFGKKFGQL